MVDVAHDLGGAEGAAVGGGAEVRGLAEEILGAVGLEVHEGDEAVVVDAAEEVALGVVEAGEVGEREVDAAAVGEVLADVAEDVGELEGVAEGDGVVAGGVGGAEDAEGDEADGAGDPVAVALAGRPRCRSVAGCRSDSQPSMISSRSSGSMPWRSRRSRTSAREVAGRRRESSVRAAFQAASSWRRFGRAGCSGSSAMSSMIRQKA